MKGVRLKSLGVALLGALAVFLASCGQQPPPANNPGPSTGTLEVVVKDQAGNAVDGANVTLTNTGTLLGITDAQGRVTATLAPGTYGVRASKAGYQDANGTATVVPGQTTTLNLILTSLASQPGSGQCRPSGDGVGLFTATLTTAGSNDRILSIQTTNGSGEHCFVKGEVVFRADAPGASLVQLFLSTSQNAQAGQLLASGTTSASYTLDTRTIPQGEERFLIAHVQIGNRVVDQVWKIVPDNLPPQLPDVREINDLNNLLLGRWVKGTKTLTLENPDLVDNPNAPGLLASGIKKVVFYAQQYNPSTGATIGSPKVIGEAAAIPYQVSWNTASQEFGDGFYHIYAVAEDLLGNQSTAPYAGFFVSVDNTAPTVSLAVSDRGTRDVSSGADVYPAQPGYVSGVARVQFSATDNVGGVGVDVSGVGLDYTGGSSISLPGTSGSVDVDVNHVSGQITFTFTARDRLGNASSKSVTVTVDNATPAISNLYLEGSPSVVDAGSQQALNARVTDNGEAGILATYIYAGSNSNATGSAVLPFWNANNTSTGGLLGLGTLTGNFTNILIPDPTNEKSGDPDSPLDLIVIARDKAGNARAETLTVQVRHVANSANQVSGGMLNAVPTPAGVEYTVTGISNAQGALYVSFFQTNALGLAGVPVGNVPSYFTNTLPVYDLVQSVETAPYRLVGPAGLFAAGFNSQGHASPAKIQ